EQARFLPDDKQESSREEIRTACKEDLQKTTADFCRGLLTERLESSESGLKFASLEEHLPRPEQLLLPHAAYDWTRAILPKLDASNPEVLLQAAAESVTYEDAGGHPWFRAAELAAYKAVLRELRNLTEKARGGSRDLVTKNRAAAETLATAWDKMLTGLPQQFKKRNLYLE